MKNIWISGSINSGKSTVSKILGKELKMAVIELDSFSVFVENIHDNNFSVRVDTKNKIPEETARDIINIYEQRIANKITNNIV